MNGKVVRSLDWGSTKANNLSRIDENIARIDLFVRCDVLVNQQKEKPDFDIWLLHLKQ